MRLGTITTLFTMLGLGLGLAAPGPAAPVRVAATVDASQRHQRIAGFGVNVTPAQWRGGALRPVLDRLADDLGASLARLDCWGTADWLDPAKRGADGRWPEAYLAEVYRGQVFRECWDTFRHLDSRGVAVHLNVSGRVPRAWTAADGQTLADFEAYAAMVTSLASWARDKEGLRFDLFGPFNETDLGPPEGPRLRVEDIPAAVKAVVRHLDAAGLGALKLVVMCDGQPNPSARVAALLSDASLAGRIAAFSAHTYGDGDEQDASAGWYDQERPTAAFVKAVRTSAHPSAAVWMTEYGDLDQTGTIEWQFAWRSTRRLLKMLDDGFNAALAWDAFDNQHLHDAAWTEYGLLKVERASWTYTPRKRWFAARQVYRFVRPGWSRLAVGRPKLDPTQDPYATWHDKGRHVRLAAFASPDGADVTIVGMNRVEGELQLELSLAGLTKAEGKPLTLHLTTRTVDGEASAARSAAAGRITLTLPEGSIFTLTTLPSVPHSR